jgi:hypothetical protein
MASISLGTALLIGSAVSGGASVASGLIGANAAGSAADKQVAAAEQAQKNIETAGNTANDKLQDVLGQQQNLLSPYTQSGTAGLNALTAALAPGGALTQQFSFDPTAAGLANNPDYQFQLQQGNQAVQRAAAASGTLNSGGTLRALDQYSQGLASTYENQYYNQALSTFGTNRNAALQNIQLPIQAGEFGTSGLLSALQNYGNQYSSNTLNVANSANNYLTQGANASAAGTIGQANAYSSALGGLANTAQLATLLTALNGGGGGLGATAGGGSVTGPNAVTPGAPLPYQITPGVPLTYQAAPSAFATSGGPLSGYSTGIYGFPVG